MKNKKILRKNKKHRVSLLSSAISLALATGIGDVSAQQDQVEEVVVTGSYIRRTEGFDAASPVTSFTAEDLEAEGTINMAQMVQNLTFNNGTGTTNSIQGTTNQIANFNLRGLGARATLTLMDGKRLVEQNVQQLLPAVALQRMDIVTDGAATIYGTDAVAGVVNLVPYKSYDGFKLEYYEEGDSRGDFRRNEISFLGGTSIDDIDIVVAGSVGHMSAFMAQKGALVVCGDAGHALGDSLYEADLYVQGRAPDLGADCEEKEMTGDDRERVGRRANPHVDQDLVVDLSRRLEAPAFGHGEQGPRDREGGVEV